MCCGVGISRTSRRRPNHLGSPSSCQHSRAHSQEANCSQAVQEPSSRQELILAPSASTGSRQPSASGAEDPRIPRRLRWPAAVSGSTHSLGSFRPTSRKAGWGHASCEPRRADVSDLAVCASTGSHGRVRHDWAGLLDPEQRGWRALKRRGSGRVLSTVPASSIGSYRGSHENSGRPAGPIRPRHMIRSSCGR